MTPAAWCRREPFHLSVMTSGIALERVSKVFGDGTAALVDVDLRVDAGELCVLLGPSGCGKSTALRLIAGLDDVTDGTIRIGDRVVNDLPARDRDVAMVFETAALYPHLDVAHNMGLALKLAGEPAEERSARVRRAADRVALRNLLRRRPPQLSAGERGRTALGRAMVRRPEAFLLDEPLANLDTRTRTTMRASIRRFHRDLGATMLYVTHDQDEAMALADRVAVMRRGRVEQVDSPRALYERPATIFVAAFVGSPPMNLMQARLDAADGDVVVSCGRQRLRVPEIVLDDRPALRRHVGRPLVLGLRPETLDTARPRETRAVLRLPVARVETLGAQLLVHLEAEGAGLQPTDRSPGSDDDDGGGVLFTRQSETLVARLRSDQDVRPGERLRVAVDLERAHFFDVSTQRVIR